MHPRPFSKPASFPLGETTSQLCENPAPCATIYPNVSMMPNARRQFLCSESIPNKYRTMRVNDIRVNSYFGAVLKIFGSFCKQLKLGDLWICEKEVTTYPILVFFTEPLCYPVMECCRKCLFIQFESELSGSVKCIGCNKVGFSFVHVDHRKAQEKQSIRRHSRTQISQHKENNYMATQKMDIDKENQRIYREYRCRNERKKTQIRKLISSNQHRQRSIKKMMELGDRSVNNTEPEKLEESGEGTGEKLKTDIGHKSEVGQFIIEIHETHLCKQEGSQGGFEWRRKKHDDQRIASQECDENGRESGENSSEITPTRMELKSIIQSIFA